MPNHRFLPTLVVAPLIPWLAWAQAPPQAPPAMTPSAPEVVATEAEQLIDQAIVKLKALPSVSADVRQEVEMLDNTFLVEGDYLKGPDYKVRLLLEIKGLPNTTGVMQQVCNGEMLWDYSNVLDQKYYSRMDLTKVLGRLDSPEFSKEIQAIFVERQLGLAGPQALLEGLRQSVVFDLKEEGEMDGVPVWILRGRWNETGKQALGLAIGPMAAVPSYVPSLVYLWLGKEDGWPYQLVMQGKKAPEIAQKRKIQLGPDGRPTGSVFGQDQQKPSRFVLKYTNVKLNPEIPEGSFAFRIPLADEPRVIDTTESMLAQLEDASRAVIADQQAKAASGEAELPAPVLDQGIAVPAPGGSSNVTPLPTTPSNPASPPGVTPR